MIFVNFKTYKEASGENAVNLARVVCEVSERVGVEVAVCPQVVDLRGVVGICQPVNKQVWAQHVDAVERGRATGWFPPEVAKEAGASGVLLSHSEHKLSPAILQETFMRCKDVGLATLIFADSLEEAKMVADLKPDYIGYEPPELVGSRTTSVATAKPELLGNVVKAVSPIRVIAGAGVHNTEDVRVSLKLGAVGIAVATDVVLTERHGEELEGLAAGFK